MGKRKREAEGDEDGLHDDGNNKNQTSKDPVLSGQISRLKKTLGHGIKSLHASLKLARGFERQKLGRRQKSATDKPHQLLRLREEVIVLKQLDLERTAKQYLVKQLVKSTRTKSHPVVVSLYGVNPSLEQPKSTAEGNVLGRLFNSAPAKQVLPGILNGLFDVLGVSAAAGKGESEGQRTSKNGNSKLEPETQHDSGSADDQQKLLASTDDVNGPDESFDGFSDKQSVDDDESEEDENAEYLSDGEMDRLLNEHQDRLASSDDDEDGDEDNDDGEDDSDLPTGHNITRGGGRSPRDDISVSVSVSLSPEPPSRSKKTQTTATTTTTTSFLPSLSLGGYYSGSESGDDDDDDDDDDRDDDHGHRGPPSAKPRNNRRGQRARQKIAEKKFGKMAKHLVAAKDNKGDRNSGWDAHRGAVDGSHQRGGRDRFRPGGGHGHGHGNVRRGQNMERKDTRRTRKEEAPRPKKRGDDQGPLHPSWEAAKKRKTQNEQNQATFAGKKITFD
ncbi:hypothetical protein H2204_009334 [Knufia peltigerae]|uniref:Bud22 domain-containing protein n=1 Tax=Knufia peltigerae TaxID=1002370 RepID=A0AA39CW27_9EURO|nr:hypothetical protein H2204_009334 [Knufia peltigerae]